MTTPTWCNRSSATRGPLLDTVASAIADGATDASPTTIPQTLEIPPAARVTATSVITRSLAAFLSLALLAGACPRSVEATHNSGLFTGARRHIVLGVDFQDSGASVPRYSRQDVEQMFQHIHDLFSKNSNSNVDLTFEITDVFRLPGNQADYGSAQLDKILTDAIANAPLNVQDLWTHRCAAETGWATTACRDVHAIVVLLSRAHDLGGSLYRHRDVGLNNGPLWVGNAVIGENVLEPDPAVWGRWAHEVGHNLQVGGVVPIYAPAHPSGYQSHFELMDANYPGRIGPVSLQHHVQHPDWIDPSKHQTFTRALGGGNAALWAWEYDQQVQPNVQAVRIELGPHLYYMVSVRRRVRGDDQNGKFRGVMSGRGDGSIRRVHCMFAGTTELSSAWRATPLARTR